MSCWEYLWFLGMSANVRAPLGTNKLLVPPRHSVFWYIVLTLNRSVVLLAFVVFTTAR